MENKTIETDHYIVVVTDSNNEILSKYNKKDDGKFTVCLIEIGEKKTNLYLNTDYFNTPEALRYGAVQSIIGHEMEQLLDGVEEKANLTGQAIGRELVEIMEQL